MTKFKIYKGTVPGSVNLCETCTQHSLTTFRSGRSLHQCEALGVILEPAVICPNYRDVALVRINGDQAWSVVGAGTERAKILPSHDEQRRRQALKRAEQETDEPQVASAPISVN